MPKIKYHFNTNTLKYEKVVTSFWRKTLRILTFLSTAVVFATIILFFAYKFFDSPKEKQLRREISQLTLQYEYLNNRLSLLNRVLKDIQDRDNTIYRVIFEAEPINYNQLPNSLNNSKYDYLKDYTDAEVMKETAEKMDKLSQQLYLQSKSFDEVFTRVKNKATMMSSIPAIQPISNRNLKMIASGFGYRVHPIYKTVKLHEGLDFTASTGTPIYATGNGTVEQFNRKGSGYGNHIIIDHGFGYETLYAHMSRFGVKPGQKVTRGQIIGYVGSTGASVGPHLHYEVIKNGSPINPINFFYNDLSPLEYEKMREIAAQSNQSFD